LILIFITPPILSLLNSEVRVTLFNEINNQNTVLMSFILLLLVFLFESSNFIEVKNNSKSSDTGRLSAIMTMILCIYLPIFDHYYLEFFTSQPTESLFFIIGVFCVFMGIGLRKWSSYTLGKHFSHSLRIIQNHQIIDFGPYKYIRHPAYTGTFLLLIGISWTFFTHIGLFLLLFFLPMLFLRITREEQILISHFGSQYKIYRNKTKYIIPFVL